ncbi:M35 family metallo-endopeptidase [uncultured Thiodictyon sp.]|uniref:M35 family metallo-endopeptidase n=1 Tax=uncultured Thiodictyon sp. TaxID=1846217 RepID=UPI0025D3F2D4|nr:M35 family metallo-endopeptidase [uncultured Thiodictyon sp.]
MSMFSEAYDALRKVVVTQAEFDAEWQKFLNKEVVPILGTSGPDSAHAAGLDKLRERIEDSSGGGFASFFLGGLVGEAIVAAAKKTGAEAGLARRCAALKMLKHLYRAEQTGAQSVWILSPPKAYSKWVFDEIVGTEKNLTALLSKEAEVYSAANRKTMCTALHQAVACAQYSAVKLGSPDPATTTVFERWFADGTASETDIAAKMTSMGTEFTRIAAVLGSNLLVFSDEPKDRTSGGWKDWGFVYSSEKMDVVYLQNAFLKASGNSGDLWKCVLTLVHEVSHRVAATDDNRYDNGSPGKVGGRGLKPDGTFTFDYATNNADSWAYFCVDLKGMLSKCDRNAALAGTK